MIIVKTIKKNLFFLFLNIIEYLHLKSLTIKTIKNNFIYQNILLHLLGGSKTGASPRLRSTSGAKVVESGPQKLRDVNRAVDLSVVVWITEAAAEDVARYIYRRLKYFQKKS